MADHDLTLAAVDPDRAWGLVRLSCTVCGPCGIFSDPYAAYVQHAKLGAAAVHQQASLDRGETVGHRH